MDENTSAIVSGWTEVSANGIAFFGTTYKMRYCLREMGKISAGPCEKFLKNEKTAKHLIRTGIPKLMCMVPP